MALGDGTTWNPSDKGTAITLSNSNRTMVTSGAWSFARSIASASSGKRYFEVTMDNDSSPGQGYFMVGFSNASGNLNSYLGADANSGGWQAPRDTPLYYPGGGGYGAEIVPGDVAGVLLDLDGGTVRFRRNNVDQGQAASGLSGTLYAALAVYSTQSATANFYEGQLVYGLPSGYSVWS
jgi:hypothetical protein